MKSHITYNKLVLVHTLLYFLCVSVSIYIYINIVHTWMKSEETLCLFPFICAKMERQKWGIA